MKTDQGKRIRIFLVDDHPLVRSGLKMMLEQEAFTVAGEANSRQSVQGNPALDSAEVVLLDLSLEQESGIELITPLCRRGLHVVVYSMHEEPGVVRRALAAGASGYVTKREAAQSLTEAIRAVVAGGSYVSLRAADAIAQQSPKLGLSPQQQQLYELLGQGFDAAGIAAALDVSPRTVESYCVRLMDKLGLHGMKELRRRAIADRQGSV